MEQAMNTSLGRIASVIALTGLVPHVTGATRHEGAAFPRRGFIDDAGGRSESFDPDNVGDIADEGAGHRG